MSNTVLQPMRSAAKARWTKWEAGLTPEQRAARALKVRASYKKEVRGEDTGELVWVGYLFDERDNHEQPMGWCDKGKHYIAWQHRRGHLAECMWRNGKLYGK